MALKAGLRSVAAHLRPTLIRTRGYGSAASALDYDYYDYCSEEEEEDTQIHDHRSRTELGPTSPERGVKWVLIGNPKHVYAEKLSKLLKVPHISMGSLVRQELNPNSSLYKEIAYAVNEGKLVTEDVVFALLSKRLEEGYCRGENGFILDGIPRTRLQAEILDQITDIDLVVNLIGSGKENLVNTRNLGSEFLGSSNSSSRTDAGNSWKEKSRIYAEQGKQLQEYYSRQRKLLDFQVTSTPGETWQRLLAALHLQHKNVVVSSQKLTA